MKYITMYIFLIFIIKIVYTILGLTHLYLTIKGKTESELGKKIVYLKKRFEFVFIVLMSILLIYLFNPIKNHINMINSEANLLFFLFGFILIFTADWNTFIKESIWFKKLQYVIRD